MMQSISTLTIKEILERYPQAMNFFIRRGMLCVGCPTEGFHSLEDVARNYRYPLAKLVAEMQKAIASADRTSPLKERGIR